MTNPIQTQANKVWQTITAPDTAATYQKAGTRTWSILKETSYLLWLVLCLGLVGGEWIWKTGYKTGWDVREWVNNLDKPKEARFAVDATTDSTVSAGMSIGESLRGAVMGAIATAKNQLGIEQTTASTPPAEPPTSTASVNSPTSTISTPAVTPPSVSVDPPSSISVSESRLQNPFQN
jgi:hypothetical protein